MQLTDGPPADGPDRTPTATVTAALPIPAHVGRADLPALCDRLTALLLSSGAAVVICDVGAVTAPDAETIDVLARLQLTARRLGRAVQLHRVRSPLRALLTISGLAEVLPVHAGGRGREAEQREQAFGVEERVDPPDAAG